MRAIYQLIVKKRWYLFIAIFVTTFLMNLIIWNETSQLIRNHSTLEVMQVEAEKGSFDFIYYPRSTHTELDIRESRKSLYQELSLLNKQGKVFYNKADYLHGGELLSLADEELEKNLSESQWSPQFLNDIILRNLTEKEFENLKSVFVSLGDGVDFVSFREQYEAQRNYYWNNMLFSLRVGAVLLLIGLLLLRWLLLSTWRICQEELKVLRLVGLSNNRIRKTMTLFLCSPIVLALFVFMVSTYLIFYFGLIGWDYVYLLSISGLQYLMVSVMVDRQLKGEADDQI